MTNSNDGATSPSQASPNARERRYLIFEFPDGVRGGFGHILGDLPRNAEGGTDNIDILRNCGAAEPEFKSVWSHSAHIVTQSTDRDLAVAECFKSHTAAHFDVGIGSDPTLRSSRLDTEQFKSLENNPEGKRPR